MPLPQIGACCRPWVAALLVLVACAEERKDPVLLEVGSRFLDEYGTRASSCAIGDQIRPALDCPAPVRLLVRRAKISDGHLRRAIRVPRELRGRPLLIAAEVRPDAPTDESAGANEAGETKRETPPTAAVLRSVAKAGPRFDLEMAVPGNWDGKASMLVVDALTPPPAVREASTTVAVPDGAQLSFGLALAAPSQAAVDFTITAKSATREATLLEARLTPDPEGRGDWKNQRVDLSSFAGEAVEILYRAEVVAGGGPAFPVWGDPQLLVPVQGQPKNLILISFDTLRADALGAYGNELGASPAIDGFAQQGALLTSALAPFPATWASHLSLMTGVYPPVHGVILQKNGGRLPEALPTLAERLAAAHYQTAAVTENGYILPEAGFSRGVSYYLEYSRAWRAGRPAASHRDPANLGNVDATFARATRWIEDHGDEVFFLFLHTYQVHFPYDPPPEHDVYTEPEDRGRALELSADALFEPKERREFAAVAKRAYTGELRFADTVFARLLARLDELGLRDRTIVIVTADHGEAFDEHGDLFHQSLYDEVLHVPLLVRAPGLVPAGGRLEGPASLVDVVPTALDLIGLPVPSDVQGVNLGPALRGKTSLDPDREVFAIDRTKKGETPRAVVRAGGTKWIEKPEGSIEVYDLDRDPGEQRNLIDPKLLAEGRARIAAFRRDAAARRARLVPSDAAAESPTIDSERERKLRALGYID